MTRFDTPKLKEWEFLSKGDVFLFNKKEYVFDNHRRTRIAATRLSDEKSYSIRFAPYSKVTIVGRQTPKAPAYKKVVTAPGDLKRGDLFVIAKKQAELFRFEKYGSKFHIINAKSVLDGKPIKLTNFECVKVTNLPF